MYETLILLGCDLGVWGWQLQGLRLDRTGYLLLLNFVVNHKPTYGSVSAGRGKWPFRVTFFSSKVERSCGQTVKDRHDFSIVLCQLYLLDHQITSRRTSEIFFGIFWHPSS